MLLNFKSIGLTLAVVAAGVLSIYNSSHAQEKQTTEPVFRVPKIAKLPRLQPRRSTAPITPVANPGPAAFPASPNLPAATPAKRQPISPAPAKRAPDAGPFPKAKSPAPIATPNLERDNARANAVPEGFAKSVSENTHPLDRALAMAYAGYTGIQQNYHDYTAMLVKRERVNNQVTAPSYMQLKIRNERNFGNVQQPLSIYMKFLRPQNVSGREVIWVQGQNQNKLIAHETSPLLRLKSFHLDPDGFVAMQGNRYPIYEAGIENLAKKLIEKAERDKKAGDCRVEYRPGAQINKRPCTMIEVIHDQKRAPYEFHRAKVYIDDEYKIPVRFAAYDWPLPGQKPGLLEEYTYINIKMNVGLTDQDFNTKNPAYKFPKR